MSNVTADRRVEHDWYDGRIPDNVVYGEGFYLETTQCMRFLRSKRNPALVIGNHVSCYSGCSFSIGQNGYASVGDYTLLNGALIMAEDRIEIGSHCLISWNVGIADSDFHPLEPALRRIDAHALARNLHGPRDLSPSLQMRNQLAQRLEVVFGQPLAFLEDPIFEVAR